MKSETIGDKQMESNIRYYVQLVNGERKPCSVWIKELLVRLHGYKYIMRTDSLEIVGK